MRPAFTCLTLAAVVFVLGLVLAACTPGSAPPPMPPPIEIDNAPYVDKANPTQVQRGEYYYWMWCMACHGGRGQGLTEEWRDNWGQDNKNCWQSKCHLMSQAGPTFSLPRVVPPVVGETALARFDNAQQLHDYLYATMPWWNPGQLTDQDAWDLAVYLMRIRGSLPESAVLSPSSASAYRVHAPAPAALDERPWAGAVTALLAVSAIIMIGRSRRR